MTAPTPLGQHQEKYDAMMRLADVFDAAGDAMREKAGLGAEILADEDVAASAELSKPTYSEAESRILEATTGRNGLMARSVELDADALIVRATVHTYRWIDDLQDAAYRTLGSIAARAVGYLAPEVELGGVIFSAGLIETEALDRDGLAEYLNELADANPELMDHLVSGGGGLLDGLQMRAALTASVLTSPDGAAVARGGLTAVGAADFATDFSAALRDVAGGFPEDEEQDDGAAAGPVEGRAPRSLEDLIAGLSRVQGEVLVQRIDGGRFIAYLPNQATRRNGTLRLVGGDSTPRVAALVKALETATAGIEDARVMLVGHAQGGATAARLAADAGGTKFAIDQVVTVGSPAAQVPRIPDGTSVLALEDRSDPVALLGSLVNAAVPNRLTVVFDGRDAASRNGGDGRGVAAYITGGRAADSAPHPELRAAIKRIQELGYLAS